LRILWRLLGWFSFLAILIFGMGVVPLVLVIALDGIVTVTILDTLRRHGSRENRSVRLAEPAPWA
jgi:hypothetical protein